MIGQTLGQYRIIEPIGQGGMATVYKVYQAGLDRYVAVKVLPPQHALTPGFKERFIREARAVAQLSHPNILPVYDFGIKDDVSYFVMKYVPDRTLGHLMGQPMELSVASRLIDQIAGALDHAHERGVVHRDIKPSNILLEGDWLLLADFGLAKIVEGSQVLTATGATIGTPAYISPEQAEGKTVDHRTDIYSLGIVLYEMVTGHVPYRGETPMGVIFKHIFDPLPLPRDVNPDLPEAVERVILKAVAKDPADRYDRAGDLAQALHQALSEAQAGGQIFPALIEPEAAPFLAADPDAPTLPSPALAAAPAAPRRSISQTLGARGLALAGIGLLLLSAIGTLILFWSGGGVSPEGQETLESSGKVPTRTSRLDPTTVVVSAATVDARPTNPPVSSLVSAITTDNVQQVEELARLGRGTIEALAVSPDGTRLAVAGSLGVWLYDAETLDVLGLLEGHEEPVTDVTWSPDGTQLASSSQDGSVRVWDATSGEELHTLRGHVGSVASVAWSPAGTLLASGGWDDSVRVWDLDSGSERHVLASHTGAVKGLAWSPDGTQLASGSRDGSVRLWDAESGREVGVLEGHNKSVASVAWSPDGKQIASAGEDETVRVWDVGDRRQRLVLTGHTSYVESVAWSPDGSQLASVALDRTIRVWDAAAGDELRVLKGHSEPVRDVVWLPGGRQLVSGADDGSVRVWGVANGQELRALGGYVDVVLSVAWSPDGRQLASGNGDGTVCTWTLAGQDAAAGLPSRRLEGHKSEVTSVAWSPDGALLASAGGPFDNRVLIWDLATEGAPRVLEGHSSSVARVAWSPDGSQLASAGWDNTVRVWTASGRLLYVLADHTDWALSVAWSPDGQYLASGSKDGFVRVWSVAGGVQLHVLQGHTKQVTSVAWSPDGSRLASAGWDETVRLWDLSEERETFVLRTQGSVRDIAWSPDGTQLATVTQFWDNVVRIWDIASGRELQALQGHLDYATSVAWSPDGARLATGGEDGSVRVWGIPGD
jgi:WD40 repeat protein/tRNA A-37 threonylcarbamoyl transferase component Bud32